MAHKIVIIGGGFGGLYTAKALRHAPAEVTLIDRRNFHLFQPLLYQVATGALAPGEIAFPIRSVLRSQKNTRVLLGEAVDFDLAERKVILTDEEVKYDTLVVAVGSENHYFGNNTWQEFAPGLKTVEDATRVRHKLLYAFEAAEKEEDAATRRAWLTFVVVGAGPTGVELAGALGEIANDVLKEDFRAIKPEEARILLLDGSQRVLPPFSPPSSAWAEKHLIKLGVRSRTGVRVTGIDATGVSLEGERGKERIDSRTVIWAAGVRANHLCAKLAERAGLATDRSGRIECGSDCTIPGHPEVFAIGDIANFKNEEGKPLAGVAQTALQQGAYAAKVIQRRLEGKQTEPFRYFDKGNMAVIGRAAAIAEIRKLKLHGAVAWLMWLFIHLMYLVTFQSRVVVFVRWGFSYLTHNRGARLITGDREPTEEQKRLLRLMANR